jgi:hypothetical protein
MDRLDSTRGAPVITESLLAAHPQYFRFDNVRTPSLGPVVITIPDNTKVNGFDVVSCSACATNEERTFLHDVLAVNAIARL